MFIIKQNQFILFMHNNITKTDYIWHIITHQYLDFTYIFVLIQVIEPYKAQSSNKILNLPLYQNVAGTLLIDVYQIICQLLYILEIPGQNLKQSLFIQYDWLIDFM